MMKHISVFPNVASTSAKLPVLQSQRRLIAAKTGNARRELKVRKEASVRNAPTNARIVLLAKALTKRIAVNNHHLHCTFVEAPPGCFFLYLYTISHLPSQI